MLYFPFTPLILSTQQIFAEHLWAGHSFLLIKISHGAIFKFWLLSCFSGLMDNTPSPPTGAHGDDWQFCLAFLHPLYSQRQNSIQTFPISCTAPIGQTHLRGSRQGAQWCNSQEFSISGDRGCEEGYWTGEGRAEGEESACHLINLEKEKPYPHASLLFWNV